MDSHQDAPESAGSSNYKTALFIGLAIIAAIATGLGVISTFGSDTDTQILNEATAVSGQDYDMVVKSSRTDSIGSEGETYHYLIVNIEVSNPSTDNVVSFIPVTQTFVGTSADTTKIYPPIMDMVEIEAIAGGQIEPGESLSGELLFKIPDLKTRWLFVFNPAWSDDKFVYKTNPA